MRKLETAASLNKVLTISLGGDDWLFKGFYGEDWRWRNAHQPGSRDHERGWSAGYVPGSVQHDLLAAGAIPDPHFEQNSLLSEWVCQRTWLYRKNFRVDAALQGQKIQLVFEGVDYDAEFYLNGEHLGNHRGMFTPAVFDVGNRLKYDNANMLVVVIQPALHEQPQVGRTSLVRTHKARMNYWWDFCPRMVHQGIWDSVSLKVSGPAVLEDIYVKSDLADTLESAEIQVNCRVSAAQPAAAELKVVLSLKDRPVATQNLAMDLPAGESTHTAEFTLQQPSLWWVNGAGEQPLYTADVTLTIRNDQAQDLSDQKSCRFGIRRVRFLKNEGAPADALPYTLEVNGQKMFINGWNWVPMDAMYGMERPRKLERLLTLAQKAHVNLLRVWGGGLIEKEAFYNLCDRLGILVWQEFIQSSSGIDNIPSADEGFIREIIAEAHQIIPRRRNHPSLAIWCGGNELSANSRPLDDTHPLLGALHRLVNELDPDRAWLPTSASGPVCGFDLAEIEKDPSRLHDVHGPWEYQGLEQQYTLYNRGASLFHSEFGVEGITNQRTLDAVIAPDHQFPVDRNNPVWFHLGAWWVKETTLRNAFGQLADIRQAVLGAQFLQYEGLRYAIEADRRRWPRNSGTIPWQFNEPFPMAACTSAVDYFAEPKPAYYAVRSAYEPLHLSASYPRLAWGGLDEFEARLWLSHSGEAPASKANLSWRVQGLSGQVAAEGAHPVMISQNSSIPIESIRCPLDPILGELFFLSAELTSPQGKSLSANRILFSRAENLAPIFSLKTGEVVASSQQVGEHIWQVTLHNPGEVPALGIWLEVIRDLSSSQRFAFFSNNYLHLFPDEEQVITVECWDETSQHLELSINGWNLPTRQFQLI